MQDENPADPKGLMREAFRIDGIGSAECRSIFLDWALSLPESQQAGEAIGQLLKLYGADAPDHPMSDVLRQGQTSMSSPRRRGGWRSRERN